MGQAIELRNLPDLAGNQVDHAYSPAEGPRQQQLAVGRHTEALHVVRRAKVVQFAAVARKEPHAPGRRDRKALRQFENIRHESPSFDPLQRLLLRIEAADPVAHADPQHRAAVDAETVHRQPLARIVGKEDERFETVAHRIEPVNPPRIVIGMQPLPRIEHQRGRPARGVRELHGALQAIMLHCPAVPAVYAVEGRNPHRPVRIAADLVGPLAAQPLGHPHIFSGIAIPGRIRGRSRRERARTQGNPRHQHQTDPSYHVVHRFHKNKKSVQKIVIPAGRLSQKRTVSNLIRTLSNRRLPVYGEFCIDKSRTRG